MRRQWIAKIPEQVPSEGATTQAPGLEDAASSWGDSGQVGDQGWEPDGVDDPESAGLAILDPPEGEDANPSGLIGTTEVGMPPDPRDRGLNATDAASGFRDPALEEEPGVVRGNDQRG